MRILAVMFGAAAVLAVAAPVAADPATGPLQLAQAQDSGSQSGSSTGARQQGSSGSQQGSSGMSQQGSSGQGGGSAASGGSAGGGSAAINQTQGTNRTTVRGRSAGAATLAQLVRVHHEILVRGVALDVGRDEGALGGDLQAACAHIVQRSGRESARHTSPLDRLVRLGVDEDDSVVDAAVGREAHDSPAETRLVPSLFGVVDDTERGHRATIRNSRGARHVAWDCYDADRALLASGDLVSV